MENLQGKKSEFITYCKEHKNLSENTLLGYNQDLKAYIEFNSTVEASEIISQENVLTYLRYLRNIKKHSAATVRRRIVTLRKFLKWYTSIDEAFISPFDALDINLRIPKRLPRPVDRETLKILFSQSKSITLPDYILDESHSCTNITPEQITGLAARILIVTGLRIGELTHLRLCDISGAASRIRVIGKGNKERTVYLTNENLLHDMRMYLRIRSIDAEPTEYLFTNRAGKRLTEATFRKRLRRKSSELNFPEYLTPHRFRHSAATLLIEEGVDIRIVQRLLGHASIATTEIYTQVSDNSLVAAIAKADTLATVDS